MRQVYPHRYSRRQLALREDRPEHFLSLGYVRNCCIDSGCYWPWVAICSESIYVASELSSHKHPYLWSYFRKARNDGGITVGPPYYLGVENQNAKSLACWNKSAEARMIINRDDVSFWENLKDYSQVVKAIKDFARANPQGKECPAPY